jgi:hypothetical protein
MVTSSRTHQVHDARSCLQNKPAGFNPLLVDAVANGAKLGRVLQLCRKELVRIFRG